MMEVVVEASSPTGVERRKDGRWEKFWSILFHELIFTSLHSIDFSPLFSIFTINRSINTSINSFQFPRRSHCNRNTKVNETTPRRKAPVITSPLIPKSNHTRDNNRTDSPLHIPGNFPSPSPPRIEQSYGRNRFEACVNLFVNGMQLLCARAYTHKGR